MPTTWPSRRYGCRRSRCPISCAAGFNDIRDFADPSVFKPVLPLIEKSGPNIKKYLAAYPDAVKKLKMNGDLFIIPATSYNTKLLAPMPCIRKDLLDKVGLPMPDDFREALPGAQGDQEGQSQRSSAGPPASPALRAASSAS